MHNYAENKKAVFDALCKVAGKRGFQRKMVERARELQDAKDLAVKGTNKKPLSLQTIFYTYALLDPSKPGAFEYSIAGRKVRFDYQPFYVGKGKGSRKADHSDFARWYPEPVAGDHKGNTIRKLHRNGLEPIVIQLSNYEIEALAFAKEEALILGIGRRNTKQGPLANMTNGLEGGSGQIMPDGWIDMIKRVNRERYRSPEERKRLSDALKGRVFSEETKAKMKASARLRIHQPHSMETREKMSKALKGRVFSAETIEKMSKAAQVRVRRPHSEETKAKMRAKALGRKHTPETVEKMRKISSGKKASAATRAKMSASHKARQALAA